MDIKCLPDHYSKLRARFKEYFAALDDLGEKSKRTGPLDEKTINLIQLAAAAAVRSEGSVHSHSRRALLAGATEEELYQALLITTSTIGFPTVSAAISWMEDVLQNK
jgi:4-carboxymuconolactone decarboxylase